MFRSQPPFSFVTNTKSSRYSYKLKSREEYLFFLDKILRWEANFGNEVLAEFLTQLIEIIIVVSLNQDAYSHH